MELSIHRRGTTVFHPKARSAWNFPCALFLFTKALSNPVGQIYRISIVSPRPFRYTETEMNGRRPEGGNRWTRRKRWNTGSIPMRIFPVGTSPAASISNVPFGCAAFFQQNFGTASCWVALSASAVPSVCCCKGATGAIPSCGSSIFPKATCPASTFRGRI